MRKRKKWLIITIICLLLAGGIGFGIYKWVKYYKTYHIDASTWFFVEVNYYDQMTQIADHVDTTTSLYINGNLDESAYLDQMQVIQQEMVLFYSSRKQVKDKYTIDLDSYTISNKAGVESAERCYGYVENLINDCIKNSADKEKLTYLYMTYMDRLYEEVSIFQTCLSAELYGTEEEQQKQTEVQTEE